MRLFDITKPTIADLSLEQLQTIRNDCKQFFIESDGQPLFKSVTNNLSFKKVKVRFRKNNSIVSETFDRAFESTAAKLSRRLVSVHGNLESDSAHYIFPKDGYQFLYNPTIVDHTEDLKGVIEAISEENFSANLSKQLLQYQYNSDNLQEAINAQAEIIIYNIPYYYAVPVQLVEYTKLLDILR